MLLVGFGLLLILFYFFNILLNIYFSLKFNQII